MILCVFEQFFVGWNVVFPEFLSFLFTSHFSIVKWVIVAYMCIHTLIPHFVVVIVSNHDVVHLGSFLNLFIVITRLVMFNLFQCCNTT